jgi:hypothetical protein
MDDLIDELKRLAEGGVPKAGDECLGICFILRNDRALPKQFKESVYSWEHYSGNSTFPVPHPDFPDNPGKGFLNTDDLWIGEYGRLRRDLCRHFLKYLEEQCTTG